MAIYRAPVDYLFGTLTNAAALTDTTITVTGTAFTNLSTGYTTTAVLPLILGNASTGAYEVVWVTGHSTGSAVLTVARGKEGTSAQAWPSGTVVLCAPTAARDALGAVNSGSMPSDAHVGWRGLQLDTGLTVEQTYSQGFQASVGVARPSDVGPNFAGVYPPSSSVIVNRSAVASGTTDGSGNATISYRQPFPITTNAVSATIVSTGSLAILTVGAGTSTGFQITLWVPSSGARLATTAFTVQYNATGW